MERLLTTDELAEYLRVDVVTIRRLVNRGELPAYRIGSEYRFSQSDLDDYLERQRVTTSTEERADAPSGNQGEWTRRFYPKGAGRFDRFNDEARRVLSFAQEEAQRFQHNYIGTEHLLLGLAREKEGLAIQVLHNSGVDLKTVREKIEYIIGRGDRIVLGEIGLTPRAKKVIELAVNEARRLNHHYIGTEHLLLGLIREGEGIAAGVLESLGVSLEHARNETLRTIEQQQVSKTHDEPLSKTDDVPAAPPEAAGLRAKEEGGIACKRCGTYSPGYFRYCFNCGQSLSVE